MQVARALGRVGLGLDISAAYLRNQARRRVAQRPRGLRPRPDVPAVVRNRALPENDWYLGAMEEITPGLANPATGPVKSDMSKKVYSWANALPESKPIPNIIRERTTIQRNS